MRIYLEEFFIFGKLFAGVISNNLCVWSAGVCFVDFSSFGVNFFSAQIINQTTEIMKFATSLNPNDNYVKICKWIL